MGRLREFGGHLFASKHQVGQLVKYAQLFDRCNFDHIRLGDHTLSTDKQAPYPNTSVLLASIGVLTKRLRLSTAVTDPYRRHPVEIAHWIATLDQLTGGRAALGIGAGEMMNLAPFGIEWDRPFERLREAIEVIRLLWTATPSNPVNYTGEIFRLRGAYLQTRPLQKPYPPIYVGAAGPKTRELVGEMADGWLPLAAESPSTLKEHLADVERGAKRAGRSTRSIMIEAAVYTDISEDEEKAYRSVEATARYVLILERSILRKRLGIEVPENLSTQRLNATDESVSDGIDRIAHLIPRGIVEEVTAAGDTEQCIKKFEQYIRAGATSITASFVGPNTRRVIETCGREIIPYLRERYSA